MKGKNTDRWAWMGEALLSPMIAVLFWFTVVVIAVMSMAHSKFFETNFFEAFGAIGQVGFAGAVFWLAHRQFEFTKVVARRQALIDTYDHRRALYDRYIEVRRKLGPTKIDEEAASELTGLAREMDRVFSPSTIAILDRLEEAAWELVEAIEDEANAAANGASTTAPKATRIAVNKRVRELGTDLYKALNEELRITID